MRISMLDVIREANEQRKREREAQREQISQSNEEPATSGSGWISAIELRRQYKAERKLEREALREAQRGQAKRNQELTQIAKIAVSRKITVLESKIRSQTEAAAILNCVMGNWQREGQGD